MTPATQLIALLAVFCLACALITALENRRLRKSLNSAMSLIEEKASFESLFATDKGRWSAMPCGTRLELADTGFSIHLVAATDPQSPYRGYTPEGICMGSCADLSVLKLFLEKHADDRAEFTPKVEAWTPNDGRNAT